MSTVNTITLVVNSITIAISLVLLALLLWQDSRTPANLTFGAFLLMVMLWSSGTLLSRFTAFVSGAGPLTEMGARLLEIGFTGSCVALYFFTVLLSGGQGRQFKRLAIVALLVIAAYQILLTFFDAAPVYEIHEDGTFTYAYSTISTVMYLSFTLTTLLVGWQRKRKIKGLRLLTGIYGFCIGMLIELVSPQLRSRGIGIDVCAVSALVISYAMVRAQIIEPLAGRANQLQAVRDVGLAITSRVRLEEVLSTIAGQAAGILQADGAAIFLNRGGTLELAAVHNLPSTFLQQRLAMGDGLAGKVAALRQSSRVENYRRDWSGIPDMPLAKETFGSVVASPLIFADEVMGVLFVVEGQYGKRFDREDMRLLELLGPQAAVAISNSRLFERQHALTSELEAAKTQLETLLTSTENPVIALNRRLEVIFANPAATELMDGKSLSGRSIYDIASPAMMPRNPFQALRELHRQRVHTYELFIKDRTYLCHLALLGRPRPQGYVAVLNDISQLKELDRLKSQMIRMTSHDLKNPLAAAMWLVELLEEEGADIFTDEIREDIRTIWAQLQRMNRIIRGILDLERIQSGSPIYEDFSVERLIQTSIQEFADQATKRNIDLRANIPATLPTISGAYQYLTQALANLIENAVKFTASGGKVTVSAEENSTHVIIHIADTGIGIPLEAQPRVFERFFRAEHPGMEQISGTGLGLSLVKSVVEAHKGQIWLESVINQGTTFHLALPLRQPAAPSLRKVTYAQ